MRSSIFTGQQSNFLQALTTQFLHLNFFHLCSNLIMLGCLLFICHKNKVALFSILLTLILGWLAVALALLNFATKDVVYLGSSGMLAALLGYCLIILLYIGKRIFAYELALSFIGFTLLIPQISILMHFSGLITGLILGAISFCCKQHLVHFERSINEKSGKTQKKL